MSYALVSSPVSKANSTHLPLNLIHLPLQRRELLQLPCVRNGQWRTAIESLSLPAQSEFSEPLDKPLLSRVVTARYTLLG